MAKKTVYELKQEEEALKAQADAIKELEGVSEKYLQTEIEIAKAVAETAKARGDYNDAAATYENNINDAADALKKYQEAAKAAESVNKGFDSALKNSIKSLTGVTDASDTLIGSFFKLKSEGKSNTEIFQQANKTFNETFTSLNVGVSIVRKVAESSLLLSAQMEQQTAAFNAQTGAGGKYNAQLRQGEAANREFGISLEQIAQARAGLMDGLSGYGVMQEAEQMRLSELTAQYAELGASTADFTGILETSTRMLGMSTFETTNAIEETRLLAQGIGISLPKALNDLNAALPRLVNFGDEAIEIFQELEKQSQATGLSVDELIGIADGFMTFDDAARAAGNLNAVLGTQMFDTMSLLEAQLQGPDAFINTLRDQLQGAGADF